MKNSFLRGYQRTVSINGSGLNGGRIELTPSVDVFEMILDYFGGSFLN